jgi:hypothetical protein
MRIVLMIVGVLALLAGIVWAGQGLGYITYMPPGMHPSFMLGDKHWVYYGAATAVIGLLIIMFARRRSGGMRG